MLSFAPFWPLCNSVLPIKSHVDSYFKGSLVLVLEELLVCWDRTIIKEICYFHERNLSALGRLLKFSFVPTGFL